MRYVVRWVAWFIAGWLVLTAAGYGFARATLPGRAPAAGIGVLPAGVAVPPLWTPTLVQAPPGAAPIVVSGPSTTIGDVLTGNESLAVVAGGSGGERTMDVPSIGSATPVETLLLAPDDGRSLALVTDHGRASEFLLVSFDTGARTGAAGFRVDGVTTLRLLGWWPDGRAVVAAYRPEPDAPATFDPSTVDGGPTRFDVVRQVSVLAVTPTGDAGELVAVPDVFLSVDIADAALSSGRTGPPSTAAMWPARPGLVAGLVAVATGALLILVVMVLLIRARGRAGWCSGPCGQFRGEGAEHVRSPAAVQDA